MPSNPFITRRFALLGCAVAMSGFAGPSKAVELAKGETGRVQLVSSGQTFRMEDGLVVRLAGIVAPKRSEPWGSQSHNGLEDMLKGQAVQLSYGGDPRDRYKRALAQVHRLSATGQPDLWVQAEMVRLGLVRVQTWPEDIIDSDALYAFEREAREMTRGIWVHESYAVRSPDPNSLAQKVDSFQLVEGIITSTADVRGRIYLNFGADYRTDFTIAIAKKHRKRFKTFDPVSLEGARIRVRGWIELVNGPMIWASHAAQIEVLS